MVNGEICARVPRPNQVMVHFDTLQVESVLSTVGDDIFFILYTKIFNLLFILKNN